MKEYIGCCCVIYSKSICVEIANANLLCISGPTQVAEVAVQQFISNDKPNCSGLILAGSANFETELNQSDLCDSR